MALRIYGFAVLLFLVFPKIYGQDIKTYRTKILGSDTGKGLENVIWQTQDKDGNTLYYGFSDSEGNLDVIASPTAATIQFRLVGYTPQILDAVQFRTLNKKTIVLIASPTEIPEVRIVLPAITQRADTINYNAASFTRSEDRYVVDLLKRLPGINVSANGAVTYQGEPIGKFYIEGHDLLGGRYTLASNNLPVEVVASVDIIENHQPVKALHGLQSNNKAALNIRLKEKFKLRPFGELEAGGGYAESYTGKFFLGLFEKRFQLVTNLKGGNTGHYILGETEDKFRTDNLFFYAPPAANYLSSPIPLTTPLSQEQYLFNQTYLASCNALLALAKNKELKIGLAQGMDWQKQNFRKQETLRIGNRVLMFQEQTALYNREQKGTLTLGYEYNGDRAYLHNTLSYRLEGEHKRASLNNNGALLGNQTNSQEHYIQNNLSLLVRTQTRLLYKFQSLLRWSADAELLSVEKKNENKGLYENFRAQELINRNQISGGYNFSKHRLGLTFESNYVRRMFNNEIETIQNFGSVQSLISPAQKLVIELFEFLITPSYTFQLHNKSFLYINLPLNYRYYYFENYKGQYPFFSPSCGVQLFLTRRWQLNVGGARQGEYTDGANLLYTPYFSSYRTVFMPNQKVGTQINYSARASLQYKNLVQLLFANFRALYQYSEQDYRLSSVSTQELTYTTNMREPAISHWLLLSSELTKTISASHLTLTATPTYTSRRADLMRQNIRFSNLFRSASLELKSEWHTSSSLFSCVYDLKGRKTWNKNTLSDVSSFNDFQQGLALYLFPFHQLELSIRTNHILYEQEKNSYQNFYLLDASAQYKYRKYLFLLKISNILNTTKYVITAQSDISSYHQEIPLRPLEIVATIKFSF